jgi:hypothetical protein
MKQKLILSKKVISNTIEGRKREQIANARIALGKKENPLMLDPKPENYDLIVKPSTHEEFIFLANELLEWSKLETSTNINDFALSKKISPYRFKRFNNEYFQECLEAVKYKIASRNRESLIKRQFNEKLYFEELSQLDRDYREYKESREDKKLGDFENTTKIVVIEKFKGESDGSNDDTSSTPLL